jgi:hypothetical protein
MSIDLRSKKAAKIDAHDAHRPWIILSWSLEGAAALVIKTIAALSSLGVIVKIKVLTLVSVINRRICGLLPAVHV